jgi:hypothetical protein
MGTITLSVPDKLKKEMDETDYINWSSVARRAFAETLADVKELDMMRKIRAISEIDESDKREVNESVAREVIESVDRTLKQGKKPMTSKDLHKLINIR